MKNAIIPARKKRRVEEAKDNDNYVQRALKAKLTYIRDAGELVPDRNTCASHLHWLIEVCLLELKLSKYVCRALLHGSSKRNATGDYPRSIARDHLADGWKHAPFTNGVVTTILQRPKLRGVVTTRRVLKGELMYATASEFWSASYTALSEDDGDASGMTDLSRAELVAQVEYTIKYQLGGNTSIIDGFRLSGSRERGTDLRTRIIGLINTCSWEIPWAGSNTARYPLDGSRTEDDRIGFEPLTPTRVMGHVFNARGLASDFNHDCLPNATMVTRGPIQFFYANVPIEENDEVTVSYGYDVLASVEDRRAALKAHADFDCTCELCRWQIAKANDTIGVGLEDCRLVLHRWRDLLKAGRGHQIDFNDYELFSEIEVIEHPLQDLIARALLDLAEGMISDFDPRYVLQDRIASTIHQCSQFESLLPQLCEAFASAHGDDPDTGKSTTYKELALLIVRHAALMLAVTMANEDRGIGMPWGDLIRGALIRVADYIDAIVPLGFPCISRLDGGPEPQYIDAQYVVARAYEYTAQF